MQTEALVLLTDIADRVGTNAFHVKGWADRLGVELRSDWAGNGAVAADDAAHIFSEIERAGRESAELHRDYERYEADWQRRQREAGEESFRRFVSDTLEQQRAATPREGYALYGGWDQIAVPVGGNTYTTANNVAEEARQQFARKNPKQTFEQFEKKWRKARR